MSWNRHARWSCGMLKTGTDAERILIFVSPVHSDDKSERDNREEGTQLIKAYYVIQATPLPPLQVKIFRPSYMRQVPLFSTKPEFIEG